MIALTAMTIQIIDNNPDGIRICRVDGESLVTVVVPRDMLGEAKCLPDLPDRGVYYLLDEDHGVLSRVYAGQTTRGLVRLDAHKTKKEFWNKAIMFLDNDVNIDRDVLDSLEAKAIDYVREHGSYETDNGNTPAPRMNPYKEQRVEDLHGSILFRMRVLGYDLDRKETTPVAVNTVFHTKKNGVRATGRYNRDRPFHGSFGLRGGPWSCGDQKSRSRGSSTAAFCRADRQSDSCGRCRAVQSLLRRCIRSRRQPKRVDRMGQ